MTTRPSQTADEATNKPVPAKRQRRSIILTDRLCEKRVTQRDKIYDRKCPGLFVSITPRGVATFSVKYTDKAAGRQRIGWLGVYNPETFTVDHARSEVWRLKGKGGDAVAATFRQQKAATAKRGKTVDEIIEERIAWIQVPVKKPDGEMRPRLESWECTASHLRRLVSPRLGKKLASDVTKNDIASLSNDIVAGRHGGKPSVSNARHMRRAASALFNWAAEAGREYVTASPCVNLPKLDAEHARTRVLSADEIRIFWHGLDREDLPWDRKTRLALKFELVTMLRSGELLPAHRDELLALDGDAPCIRVPAKRVKKRRVIEQPLSDLAVEIIREAMATEGQQFVFESPLYPGQPMHRTSMATALRGTQHENNKDKSKKPGLCELLGLKKFTPHDLRRTAATLAGNLGYSDAAIAKCLDHAVTKDDGERINRVTGIYNQSKRMQQKRAVLEGIAAALRRIVGEPAEKAVEQPKVLVAA
ncbi:integrase [Bradyrhizobium jicamae]|uniref:Integrase n=1 Tax=Bradyrhizobium jicamae TaxID=280332 RepID=A0A0R3M4N2_9BRAD|nr:tyrosine-type recombinase/integrase [Bradyrhizobium jicamae]KRR14590.1 integrase [Bradyrhizobium jicamae]